MPQKGLSTVLVIGVVTLTIFTLTFVFLKPTQNVTRNEGPQRMDDTSEPPLKLINGKIISYSPQKLADL